MSLVCGILTTFPRKKEVRTPKKGKLQESNLLAIITERKEHVCGLKRSNQEALTY
jgi:hypothetical protein